jgi:uncharacterized protein
MKNVFCVGALLAASCLSVLAAGTRLVDAAEKGDRTAVLALIQQKADVNEIQADGTTALHWAAQRGDVGMAEALIKAGAKVNAVNRYGMTPLLVAATYASGPITSILLKTGADADGLGPAGESALLTAARSGNLDAAKALVAAGANVNAVEPSRKQTALIWAAATNQSEIVKLLLANKAEVDARDKVDTVRADYPVAIGAAGAPPRIPLGGATPLILAARQGDRESVKALLDAGADINAHVTSDGATALLLTIANTHYDLASYLLERGADPNQTDLAGVTPLFMAVDMHKPDIVARPPRKERDQLTSADIVKQLLAKRANPNAGLTRQDSGMGPGSTPFLRAAKSGDIELMNVLLDHGADLNQRAADQNSALILAAGAGLAAQFGTVAITESEAVSAVKYLLDKGQDINAVNGRGDTAVHAAVNKSWDSVIRTLAERGAKLDIKNRQGLTPMDIAEGRGGRGGVMTVLLRKESTIALLKQLMQGGSAQTAPAKP